LTKQFCSVLHSRDGNQPALIGERTDNDCRQGIPKESDDAIELAYTEHSSRMRFIARSNKLEDERILRAERESKSAKR
jgi:hypothetical protein